MNKMFPIKQQIIVTIIWVGHCKFWLCEDIWHQQAFEWLELSGDLKRKSISFNGQNTAMS